MAESEHSIHEVLTKLASQLASIKCKVDDSTTDLGRVHEPVNLAMTSISQVQGGASLHCQALEGDYGLYYCARRSGDHGCCAWGSDLIFISQHQDTTTTTTSTSIR
jgi:hypothetical protein